MHWRFFERVIIHQEKNKLSGKIEMPILKNTFGQLYSIQRNSNGQIYEAVMSYIRIKLLGF